MSLQKLECFGSLFRASYLAMFVPSQSWQILGFYYRKVQKKKAGFSRVVPFFVRRRHNTARSAHDVHAVVAKVPRVLGQQRRRQALQLDRVRRP
eukprot:COSAG06_NODE_9387_length_1914_cov_1.361983_2_plen_94_part_00